MVVAAQRDSNPAASSREIAGCASRRISTISGGPFRRQVTVGCRHRDHRGERARAVRNSDCDTTDSEFVLLVLECAAHWRVRDRSARKSSTQRAECGVSMAVGSRFRGFRGPLPGTGRRSHQDAEVGGIECACGDRFQHRLYLAGDVDGRLRMAAELEQFDL
jgi:hypothetical protein